LPDNLLYVGMSRAISKLIIVGPPALRARLGLGNEEMTSD
jgi:ATP-dependent exoDNAse (exonuclease V) beta subunit